MLTLPAIKINHGINYHSLCISVLIIWQRSREQDEERRKKTKTRYHAADSKYT